MKRLLYIANPFPPSESGGTARHLRFLRYLPACGWQPTVLTVRAQGPVSDPPDVRIERAGALDLERLYALARRVAGPKRGQPVAGTATTAAAPSQRHRTSRRGAIEEWLQIPDVYVSWIVPAVLLGRRLLREQRYDAIFSSYPRGSAHLVAAELAKESGIPWVADYRDPWRTYEFRHYPTRWHKALNEWLESRALSQASAVTVINEPMADEMRRLHPGQAAMTTVIPNGYDPEEEIDEVDLGRGFWIVYTGRVYGRSEQVNRFLDAFAALPDDVHILFLGVGGSEITARCAALGIADRVLIEPFAPRARALGVQRAADALLLITGLQRGTMTGKVFEYLASERPVFAQTPRDSVARELIDEADAGRCVAPDEPLGPALAAFVADVRGGRLKPPNLAVVHRFDGRVLTRQLAEILDSLAKERR